MSANGTQTPEESAVNQQVDAALRECAALTAALRQARRSRLLFLVLILAFVLVVVGVAYNTVWVPWVDGSLREEAVNRMQDYFEKNRDTYLREVRGMADTIGSKVTDVFSEQAKKDMPVFMRALDKERAAFSATLESKFQTRLEEHYHQLVLHHEKTLKDQFPAITDPVLHERMVKNIDRAVQKIAKHYYIDEMDRQLKFLFDTWDHFPAAEPPKDGKTAIDECMFELPGVAKYLLSRTQR